MAQINKLRQQMYLDGKVGVKYNGELEQLREITKYPSFSGSHEYYHSESATRTPLDGIKYYHTSWFYEEEDLKPSLWRLDIDIPEWELKKDDTSDTIIVDGAKFDNTFIPYTILKFIATPFVLLK